MTYVIKKVSKMFFIDIVLPAIKEVLAKGRYRHANFHT